jgi:hypothetical protein
MCRCCRTRLAGRKEGIFSESVFVEMTHDAYLVIDSKIWRAVFRQW